MDEYLNEKLPDISEGTYVKALNRLGTDRLEEVLEAMNYHLEDIYESLCYKEERLYIRFMNDLINIVNEIHEENRKKNYNPDVEYLKLHPDTTIFNSND
jgi:hypothetical protein